jgi:DNA invertase Pin-like site-specific DNA recombinase
MKDAISYIRVSSEEQADSGLGLEAQRQRIAAHCAMKGLRLAEVFKDPAISAGKPWRAGPREAGCWLPPRKARRSSRKRATDTPAC